MSEYLPKSPSDFLLLYSAVLVIALLYFFYRRPRQQTLLRLRAGPKKYRIFDPDKTDPKIEGEVPAPPSNVTQFSRVQPAGERPLNVMFNYNGHSWDAYEVLGLPAGSSPEKVHDAFSVSMKSVDPSSKPFMEAAYRAIRAEWDAYKKSGTG
jgi:hypothetical protein